MAHTKNPTPARWLVCGSRTWKNYGRVKRTLDRLAKRHGLPYLLIEGGAAGADACAVVWADRSGGITVETHDAEWRRYGKMAGPVRNAEMARRLRPGVDLCVAFWDGKSRGTANMIALARNRGVRVVVVRPA